MAHLAVFAFDERELDPAGGNIGSETHRRVAGPEPIGFASNFCFAGLGMVAFDVNAFSEFVDRLFGDLPIHLREVRARVLEFWVEQLLDEFPVVC